MIADPHELYRNLLARRFSLRADGDRLFVEPRADLLPQDIEGIKAHKPALLGFLAAKDAPVVGPDGTINTETPCPQCARPAKLQHRASRTYFCAWCRFWIEK